MPPKKRARDEPPADPLAPDVLLIVGPERVELQAHSHSLCTASDFFKSALLGGLQESATRTIELPEYEVEDIKLLLAILAYEAFIDPSNVARLGRLFNRLSMSAALRKKAEDLISYTVEYVGFEHIELPGIEDTDEAPDVYVELVKLAVDANFINLLKVENADGTVGDGELMLTLRRHVEGRPYAKPGIWPSLGELADFRYHEYFSSLWPDIRKAILSPEQLETDDLKEPPAAEVARYIWPALVQSAVTRNSLELTRIDCAACVRRALGINTYTRDYVMVRKHKTTGQLGPDVDLGAATTKFVESVHERMPDVVFYGANPI